MRYLLISAAAAFAVAGAAALASAQDDKGKGQGEAPAPGAAQKAPGSKAPEKAQRQETEVPKAAQPQGAKQPKAAQQPAAPEKQQSTQQKPGKDQPKAAQQPAAGTPKSAEHKAEPGKDQPKAAQQQPAQDKQKQTEQKQAPGKDQPKAAEQGTDKAGGHVQVSQEQRTNIRQQLAKENRVEKTRINVTVNIGRTIPRSVRLHALPVAIVAIAPAYRGYQYVLLEDETIIIVDPRTYVVVDVISNGGPGHASLALSADDRRFLFTSLPKTHRADVHVRLALGAEVPRNVELLSFPSVAVQRVPSVQRYRYIVSGDDIVIVDPNDYSVALVISD